MTSVASPRSVCFADHRVLVDPEDVLKGFCTAPELGEGVVARCRGSLGGIADVLGPLAQLVEGRVLGRGARPLHLLAELAVLAHRLVVRRFSRIGLGGTSSSRSRSSK